MKMLEDVREIYQEEICALCESQIIEGSSCSTMYICEGAHCEQAQQMFMEEEDNLNKILVLDIETTGFLNQGGSIVEVGMVELNLENGEVKEVFNSLVREDILTAKHREAPYGWIFKNSDLTVEEVRNAPNAKEVFPKVQEVLDKYPLGCTAFNNAFDFGFLRDRGLKIKGLPCPMKLATPICKIPSRNGYSGYKWPNVEEAFAHFFPDIEYVELHRGADDAKHEAMIVYELYKQGVFVLN